MATGNSTLRTCENGHQYYKSSDCPVCPVCEREEPTIEFMATLAAPARRALENNGITTLEKLSVLTEQDVLAFHGMGKTSIPKLKKHLRERGLAFKR